MANTARPGTKPTPQSRKRRPQQKIKFAKGFGKPLKPADIKKRHQQFLRQQRENKVKVQSLVGRDYSTGRQAAGRTKFLRGAKIKTSRLKQFAEYGQMAIIREERVSSSWVSKIYLIMLQNGPALAISFRDGFTALYPSTNIRDYEAMSAAASKGGYIWAALYHGYKGQGAPYQELHGLG